MRDVYPTLPRNPVRVLSFNRADVNMGRILRTADGIRAEQVTFTTQPHHKLSTACGTEKWQPWNVTDDPIGTIVHAFRDGYTPVILEYTGYSQPLYEARLPTRMCMIVGDERDGVPAQMFDYAAFTIYLPQLGMGRCLNVATATSIALYEWHRQHQDLSVSSINAVVDAAVMS